MKQSKFKNSWVYLQISYKYTWYCGDNCCSDYEFDTDTVKMPRNLATYLIRALKRTDSSIEFDALRWEIREVLTSELNHRERIDAVSCAKIV